MTLQKILSKTLAAVLVLSVITSCGTLPDKPIVDLCAIDLVLDQTQNPPTIDYEHSKLICSPTGKMNPEKMDHKTVLKFVKASPDRTEIPLSQADTYIAFSPSNWGVISVYMKILRDKASKCLSSTDN